MHLRDIVKVKTNTHTKYSTNPISIMLKIYFKQRKLPDGTVHNLAEPERYFTAMGQQPEQVGYQECKIMFNPFLEYDHDQNHQQNFRSKSPCIILLNT